MNHEDHEGHEDGRDTAGQARSRTRGQRGTCPRLVRQRGVADDTCDPFKEIKDAWDWLLIQGVVVRHYDGLNFLGPRFDDSLLDRGIISLLTVALASFLDETLQVYISHSGTPGRKNTLSDKIEILKDAGEIDSTVACQLHAVRNARNAYAPRATNSRVLEEKTDWKRLDEQRRQVGAALRQLGVLGPQQRYEYFAERIPVEPPNKDAVVSLKYRHGVKRDAEEAYVHEFVVNHYGLGGETKTSVQ